MVKEFKGEIILYLKILCPENGSVKNFVYMNR